DRLPEPGTLGDAVAFGHRAGAHVAHDALDRDHLQRLDQRIVGVEHADEMRAHAGVGKLAHDERVDPVVGLAFLLELRDLYAIERAGVVAEMHHQKIGIVGGIDGLRLAAIELLSLFHVRSIQTNSRHANPACWSAMPTQSGAQLTACASAARASSGRLLCCERWAANRCFSLELSSLASRAAAASLSRCPNFPAMRSFSE